MLFFRAECALKRKAGAWMVGVAKEHAHIMQKGAGEGGGGGKGGGWTVGRKAVAATVVAECNFFSLVGDTPRRLMYHTFMPHAVG